METLISLLLPIIFVIIAVLNIRARARQIRRQDDTDSTDKGVFEARPDEVREFLRSIGMPVEEEPRPPAAGWPPAMPQGRVTPSAPRARSSAAGGIRPPSQRTSAPPVREEEGESTTRRLVHEGEYLTPSVAGHLRERHLGEGERTLEPTVDVHVRQRRLAEGQQPIEPSIDAHLKEARLEEQPAPAGFRRATAWGGTGATGANQIQARRGGTKLPFFETKSLRQALVMSEVLQPPLALRHGRSGGTPGPRGLEP